MNALLRLDDVTIRRGGTDLVTALDLRLRVGRIFWVIGPNGAGKSSLLRVMAGLDSPTAGTVRAPAPGGLLYFHSEMALPGASTVADWARLVERTAPGAGRGRTDLWPDVPGGRAVRRLSTGERKRLLLDALLRRRGSLLLDEPYEHLSPDGKRALTRLLEERARAAVVVVATNQSVQRALVDGGIRIEAGSVRRIGSGREAAREHP